MEFVISKLWNGDDISHPPTRISIEGCEDGVHITIAAPFFNDPGNPGGAAGKPFGKLWDYEVVEVFFLDSKTEEYLEVEFCPHGQHQILALKGRRKPLRSSIELENFTADIAGSTWTGAAVVPWGYFPKTVDRMNAYAIHGSGPDRQYESLYPAEKRHEEPDFHRLEYFQPFEFKNACLAKTRSITIWCDT